MQLSAKGMKILKFIHLATACCWLGGALSILILFFAKRGLTDAAVVVGINTASRWVDMGIVVVLGAMGCLLTGLVYSACTSWGFFRHRWVLIKWLLTITLITTGTIYLGPWEEALLAMSQSMGNGIFTSDVYIWLERKHAFCGMLQVLALFVLVYISVAKPWRKKKEAGDLQSAPTA